MTLIFLFLFGFSYLLVKLFVENNYVTHSDDEGTNEPDFTVDREKSEVSFPSNNSPTSLELDNILNKINPSILKDFEDENEVSVVANNEDFQELIRLNEILGCYLIEVIPNTLIGYRAGENLGIYTVSDNHGIKINFTIKKSIQQYSNFSNLNLTSMSTIEHTIGKPLTVMFSYYDSDEPIAKTKAISIDIIPVAFEDFHILIVDLPTFYTIANPGINPHVTVKKIILSNNRPLEINFYHKTRFNHNQHTGILNSNIYKLLAHLFTTTPFSFLLGEQTKAIKIALPPDIYIPGYPLSTYLVLSSENITFTSI